MIQLDEGNVLLKPSHRKQLMGWLKRSLRLGQRIGDFALNITLKRIGRSYEVRTVVRDRGGDFVLRHRATDWRNALRSMVQELCHKLHDQSRAIKLGQISVA